MSIAPDLEPYTRMDNKHVNPEYRPTQEQYDKYLTIVQFGDSVGWNQRRLTDEGPFLMADPNLHFVLLRADKDLLAMAGAYACAAQAGARKPQTHRQQGRIHAAQLGPRRPGF